MTNRFIPLLCFGLALFSTPALAINDESQFKSWSVQERYDFFKDLNQKIEKQNLLVKGINQYIPSFARNLIHARRVSRMFWTDSTVIDASTKQPVLTDKVLKELRVPQKKSAGIQHVSAGYMHTYGYLFSVLPTPWGLKSKRWLESRIDHRLGLPEGTWSPFCNDGEFLSNLTHSLFEITGGLSHREKQRELSKRISIRLQKALRKFDEKNHLGAVQEEVRLKDGSEWKVHTHLIRLQPSKTQKDTHLLAYEIIPLKSNEQRGKWVTAFPIQNGFAQSLMKTAPTQDPAQFKARYNWYAGVVPTAKTYKNKGFVPAKRQ